MQVEVEGGNVCGSGVWLVHSVRRVGEELRFSHCYALLRAARSVSSIPCLSGYVYVCFGVVSVYI